MSLFQRIIYRYLRPVHIYESIFDVDFGALYDDGIRSLFFDIDNTIISYIESDVSLQTINLFNQIKSYGFDSIILLSNHSNIDRVNTVANQLDLPGVAFACKPFVFTARRIMKDYSMSSNSTAIIGDQLSTDILIGNALNLVSIFVDPINVADVSTLKRIQYRFQQLILDSF